MAPSELNEQNNPRLLLPTFLPLFCLPTLLGWGVAWEGGKDQLKPRFDLRKREERVKMARFFSPGWGVGGGEERGQGRLGQECVIRSKLSPCLGLTLVSPEELKGIL